mgnify:CR=1 FL=1
MASSEQTNVSQAAEQMQFAGDFGDGLTTAEKLETAAKFDSLVNSTLSRFADSVRTYGHCDLCPGMIERWLYLVVSRDKDGSSVTAQVKLLLRDDGEEIRNISINERRGGCILKHYGYHLEDGAVMRRDKDFVRARRESLYEGDEPEELEQELGLSRQPVGIDGINKLAELLEAAQVPRRN